MEPGLPEGDNLLEGGRKRAMTTVRFCPGPKERTDFLVTGLVVAIDLGFSKAKNSCGVAWRRGSEATQTDRFRFGGCVKHVANLLTPHRRAVLIVEAPLSGLFTIDGDPMERGEFEKTDPDRARFTPRYWYYGSGGAMCLAAIFFLRELNAEVRRLAAGEDVIEIVLYEGFVSFKTQQTEHDSDAQLLLHCFVGTHPPGFVELKASDGQTLVTLSDVVDVENASSKAPAIIVPRQDEG